MSKYRHSRTTMQIDLSLEAAVLEYQRQEIYYHDHDTALWYLSFVRKSVKGIFKDRRLPWDIKAETFLKTCIMQYDIYAGMPFQAFFVACMERDYNLQRLKPDESSFVYAEAVHGNSNKTFQESWTSKPEQMNLDKMPKRKERRISE